MGNSGGEFHRYVVIIVITVVDILDKVSECDSTLLCDVTGAADAAADAGVARRPIVTALTSVRLPRRRIHALCVTNIYNNKTIILEIDLTIDSYLTFIYFIYFSSSFIHLCTTSDCQFTINEYVMLCYNKTIRQ